MAKFQSKSKEQKEELKQLKKTRPAYEQPGQVVAPEDSHPDRASNLLRMQQTYGNRYVQRLAETSEGAMVNGDIVRRIEAQRGSGRPLEPEVRSKTETAFGHDFGQVRIHTDAEADRLSRQLRAKAFTTGKDIFFRQGTYQPYSADGTKLIAHELAHVVQQSNASPCPLSGATHPKEATEIEARESEGQFPSECKVQQELSPAILACDNSDRDQGDESGGQPATYVVTIRFGGIARTGTLREMITMVRNRVEAEAEAHQHFRDRIHTPVIADICDLFGGVSLPPVTMWQRPRSTLARAGMFLNAGMYDRSLELLRAAIEEYNDCHNRWYDYREGTVRGGERTVTGLEITSAVLISVGATVGTAGLAPTAGLLTEAVITAGLTTGGTALAELGREASEWTAGVDAEFNWERFLANLTTSGATAFIGSCVSGAFRPLFARLFPIRVGTPERFDFVNRRLIEMGLEPLERELFIGTVARSINRLISAIPAAFLNSVLNAVVEFYTRNGPPRSLEEFIEKYVDTLVEQGWTDIVTELLAILGERAVTGTVL